MPVPTFKSEEFLAVEIDRDWCDLKIRREQESVEQTLTDAFYRGTLIVVNDQKVFITRMMQSVYRFEVYGYYVDD